MSFRSISSPEVWAPSSAEDEGLLSSINTTPLVDVMLVLLIIFLITVPVVRQTVPVSLPQEQERNTARELTAQTIEITVTREGALFWNGQPVANLAALSTRLAAAAQQEPPPAVQLRGDEATPYVRIGRVVDACQRAGIRQLGFVTEPPAR